MKSEPVYFVESIRTIAQNKPAARKLPHNRSRILGEAAEPDGVRGDHLQSVRQRPQYDSSGESGGNIENIGDDTFMMEAHW